MPRESWTDERLDDFRSDVDRRFDKVDERFDRLEGRMDAQFEALESKIDRRLDSLNHLLIGFSSVLIAGLLTMVGIQL